MFPSNNFWVRRLASLLALQVYFKRISNREIAKQLESLGNNGITSHPIFDIRNTEEEKRFYGENILKEIFILHTIHRGFLCIKHLGGQQKLTNTYEDIFSR